MLLGIMSIVFDGDDDSFDLIRMVFQRFLITFFKPNFIRFTILVLSVSIS